MVRLLSLIATAAISISSSHAFVAPGSIRVQVTAQYAKLEGREIEGTLTPTNNFVLIKKAGIQDTTEGGILLTGKVSSNDTYCFIFLDRGNHMFGDCKHMCWGHISFSCSIMYIYIFKQYLLFE